MEVGVCVFSPALEHCLGDLLCTTTSQTLLLQLVERSMLAQLLPELWQTLSGWIQNKRGSYFVIYWQNFASFCVVFLSLCLVFVFCMNACVRVACFEMRNLEGFREQTSSELLQLSSEAMKKAVDSRLKLLVWNWALWCATAGESSHPSKSECSHLLKTKVKPWLA